MNCDDDLLWEQAKRGRLERKHGDRRIDGVLKSNEAVHESASLAAVRMTLPGGDDDESVDRWESCLCSLYSYLSICRRVCLCLCLCFLEATAPVERQ